MCLVDREAYVEAVLRVVEQVPPGRVISYGAIAAVVGVGGPRQVGAVMAEYGGGVPWWRVVRADGTLPLCHDGRARAQHRAERTPMRGDRADMSAASWSPSGRTIDPFAPD
ncbi:MAG TPA: MGMT family protein [Nocardioidaceae bacterium]|nr:MGMT family protein [Nocardioidaceae bacterium]